MSKINFPQEGIYGYCRDNLDEAISNIYSALSNSTFDIPSNFNNAGYMRELNSLLNKCYSEISSINLIIQTIDQKFTEMSDILEQDAKKMESIKIQERERLIL